jgi:RNA polymerase sigma-70 factor (ECF subfamily)
MKQETPLSAAAFEALRQGDPTALDDFVRRYRPWLGLLARLQAENRFQGKFDASDLVQQTMMEACRALPQFRGQTEAELLAWLRQILAHVFAHEIRRYQGTQGRDLDLEVSLDQQLGQTSQRLNDIVAPAGSSPSQKAVQNEQEVRLAEVLAALPDDYREVIILRNMEGLSHEEVAKRMDRGVGAVRMLWVRALTKLREALGGD